MGRSQVEGGTVGEALQDLTRQFPALQRHLYTDDGALRSFVNLFLTTRTCATSQRRARRSRAATRLSIIPSIAGGAAPACSNGDGVEELPELSPAGDPPLQPPPDPARGRHRRAAQAQGGQGADDRRRRPRLAARPLPRGGGGRHARAGRLRRRRREQPPPPGAVRPLGRGAAEDPGRRRPPARPQPAHQGRPPRDAARLLERPGAVRGLRHHRRRHRQLPHPLPGQRRLRAARASRTSTARSSASRGRCRSSGGPRGPATAACSPSRRRRGWSPPAPRGACSACCRGSSARSRPTR